MYAMINIFLGLPISFADGKDVCSYIFEVCLYPLHSNKAG